MNPGHPIIGAIVTKAAMQLKQVAAWGVEEVGAMATHSSHGCLCETCKADAEKAGASIPDPDVMVVSAVGPLAVAFLEEILGDVRKHPKWAAFEAAAKDKMMTPKSPSIAPDPSLNVNMPLPATLQAMVNQLEAQGIQVEVVNGGAMPPPPQSVSVPGAPLTPEQAKRLYGEARRTYAAKRSLFTRARRWLARLIGGKPDAVGQRIEQMRNYGGPTS